jgi:hypothetical protein
VPPSAKVAVTAFVAALKVTEQPALPVHAPDHPENMLGAVGVSLRVTALFGGNVAVQAVVEPVVQLIPDGLLVTVPVPLPERVTVNASPALNVAATFSAPVMARLHVDVPVHAPLQPPK